MQQPLPDAAPSADEDARASLDQELVEALRELVNSGFAEIQGAPLPACETGEQKIIRRNSLRVWSW